MKNRSCENNYGFFSSFLVRTNMKHYPLLLTLAVCALLLMGTGQAFSQTSASILTGNYTVDQLSNWLVASETRAPYPKWGAAWKDLPRRVRISQIDIAEAKLGTTIPQVTASLLLEFSQNGNRSRHGAIYFEKRNRLAQAVAAECLEQKGQFLNEITNLIWSICEESFWVIPAHYGPYVASGLPDAESEYVDLFAAETGALLAWTHYLLADQLDSISPALNTRILTEIDERILQPNLTQTRFWWMGLEGQDLNNWTPWVCSNWLTCVVLTEQDPRRKAEAVHKIMGCLDRFLDAYPADGGCDEGPGYWGRAGASLFECLELLEWSTQGKVNVWDEPLVANMGQYIYKVHIKDSYYVNFADASAVVNPNPPLIFRYGQKIGDPQMTAFAAWLAKGQDLYRQPVKSNLARILATLQSLSQLQETLPQEPFVSQSWLPDLQVLVARKEQAEGKGFFLAAKGGHNDESHNHNDIGNFILYHDGQPVIIDIGVETYTKKTFSSKRYEIWTMQSQYHNLPTINGVMQEKGREFKANHAKAQLSDEAATFSLDIGSAYPKSAGVTTWNRSITYDRNQEVVRMSDSYELNAVTEPTILNFMAARKPHVDAGKHTISMGDPAKGEATIAFSYPANLKANVEEIPITDGRLLRAWGDFLYRIQLTDNGTSPKGSYSYEFSVAQPAQEIAQAEMPKLDNPISVDYLKKNLPKSSPRLVLNKAKEKILKQKLKTDPVVQNYYAAIKLNAEKIVKEPLLTRKVIGRRLLATSREMLYRMGVLGMVYRIEKDPTILKRIDEEVQAVCRFSDWNPSHYLDVAEMSMAVAFAVDWTGKDLPKTTRELALNALIEKGIMPSYNKEGNVGWINGSNNWNQVCNGGMIAAAIAIAEKDPELAATTIHRALEGIPHVMKEYGPDGVYPEGSTYWGYGTGFSVVTSAMLQSAFGTDFGIAEYPAFLESADFRLLSNAPSGWYYNFADCGDKRGEQADIILAWFATHTGNSLYLEKDRFLKPAAGMGKLSRISGPGLVWLAEFEDKNSGSLPLSWKGDGGNPLVIFRGGEDDPGQYYFGGKGGKASISHGNMDAGSFIFELDGIRWGVDAGNQNYHALEKTGFSLWGRCQACERWTLLTKNNFGHSTLTINNEMHAVNGFASLIDFQQGEQSEATFDLSPVFGGESGAITRRFVKEDSRSILIEDQIQVHDSMKQITWQMMTTADVEVVAGGAILKQDGKQLKLENLSHPNLALSIISLDPAPLELDRQIKGLKRIEIRIPAYSSTANIEKIRVRLSGK